MYGESALLPHRLMYGTDWQMLVNRTEAPLYLERFISVMARSSRQCLRRPGGRRLAEAFFGWNAVDYFGATRGLELTGRLDAFYTKHGVPTPDWIPRSTKRGVR